MATTLLALTGGCGSDGTDAADDPRAGQASSERPIAQGGVSPEAEPSRVFSQAALARLGASIEEAVVRYSIPGVAVAIVEGPEKVYSRGFGFRNVRRLQPITDATLFRVGEVTRPMSAAMLAALADRNAFEWRGATDPLSPDGVGVELLTRLGTATDLDWAGPSASELGPPTLEAVDNMGGLSTATQAFAEVAGGPGVALRKVSFSRAVREICGRALAGETPAAAYRRLMQEELFGPAGMNRSAVAYRLPAMADDHATAYATDLDGGLVEADYPELPATAPADGAVSTADDLARFLILQFHGGFTPEGQRVVSAANLAELVAPDVVPKAADAGIGAEPRANNEIDCPDRPLAEACGAGLAWVETRIPGGARGHEAVGGVDGFSAALIYLDSPAVGLVVLTNMDPRTGGLAFVREVRDAFQVEALGLGQALPDVHWEKHRHRLAERRSLGASVGRVSKGALGPWIGPWENGWRVEWNAGRMRLSRAMRTFELAAHDGSYVILEGPHLGTRVRFETVGGEQRMIVRDATGQRVERLSRNPG